MISFMNMGKNRPNEEPDDDEEEGSVSVEKKPVPVVRSFMSWQDALFLLVIAALVVGGYCDWWSHFWWVQVLSVF